MPHQYCTLLSLCLLPIHTSCLTAGLNPTDSELLGVTSAQAKTLAGNTSCHGQTHRLSMRLCHSGCVTLRSFPPHGEV